MSEKDSALVGGVLGSLLTSAVLWKRANVVNCAFTVSEYHSPVNIHSQWFWAGPAGVVVSVCSPITIAHSRRKPRKRQSWSQQCRLHN